MSEYPKKRQIAVIGVFINENGEATDMEWANPLGTEQNLANKYLKAVKSWKFGYAPALNHHGEPVGKWRYFHFHFGSSSDLH